MKNKNLHSAKWQHTLCALSACAALSGAAQANNYTYGWSGNLTLGFEHATGTTNSRDVHASLTLEHNKDFQASLPFRHRLRAAVDTEKTKADDGTETKTRDKDAISYQLGYFLDPQSHIRATLAYLHDISLKVDAGKVASIEYIRNVLTSSAHQLNLGIGVAYLDYAYTDTRPEVEEVGGQISYDYTGQLTEDFSLHHEGLLQATADLRYATLDTGISYALTQNMSLSLTHHYSTLSDDVGNRDDERNSTTHLTIGVTF